MVVERKAMTRFVQLLKKESVVTKFVYVCMMSNQMVKTIWR